MPLPGYECNAILIYDDNEQKRANLFETHQGALSVSYSGHFDFVYIYLTDIKHVVHHTILPQKSGHRQRHVCRFWF